MEDRCDAARWLDARPRLLGLALSPGTNPRVPPSSPCAIGDGARVLTLGSPQAER